MALPSGTSPVSWSDWSRRRGAIQPQDASVPGPLWACAKTIQEKKLITCGRMNIQTRTMLIRSLHFCDLKSDFSDAEPTKSNILWDPKTNPPHPIRRWGSPTTIIRAITHEEFKSRTRARPTINWGTQGWGILGLEGGGVTLRRSDIAMVQMACWVDDLARKLLFSIANCRITSGYPQVIAIENGGSGSKKYVYIQQLIVQAIVVHPCPPLISDRREVIQWLRKRG